MNSLASRPQILLLWQLGLLFFFFIPLRDRQIRSSTTTSLLAVIDAGDTVREYGICYGSEKMLESTVCRSTYLVWARQGMRKTVEFSHNTSLDPRSVTDTQSPTTRLLSTTLFNHPVSPYLPLSISTSTGLTDIQRNRGTNSRGYYHIFH